jgi:glucose-1-phosphate thymidylyltransferase
MKGVILAGGFGTRLKPLTDVTNKHLLPVYNKPVIFYPLQTLLDAGVKEILIVTGPEHAGGFMNLLGSGERFGAQFYFAVQETAGGIAQAAGLAESFVGDDNMAIILGDNIFEGNFKAEFDAFESGSSIFLKDVHDPERFGVPELEGEKVVGIEEKPSDPKSKFAVTGLYLYDSSLFEIIKTLKPSGRGELEITDVNNAYVGKGQMNAVFLKGSWTDAGTFESLYEANTIARNIALKKSQ